MSLGLYMDVHVPLPITRGLRRLEIDVITAQDDRATRLSDPELLDRAMFLNRLMFSQDQDMLVEAVKRQRASQACATVIFAAQMQCSIGRCISDLAMLADSAVPADATGQIIYL